MSVNILPERDEAGNIISGSPFASKHNLSFDGEGFKGTAVKNTDTNIDWTVTAKTVLGVTFSTFLFDAIEVLNGAYGDKVQLQVLDDATGTYSGYPSIVLDQFGTNWNMRTELIKKLPYNAKLMVGMVVRVVYTNSTDTDKTVYVHRLKI